MLDSLKVFITKVLSLPARSNDETEDHCIGEQDESKQSKYLPLSAKFDQRTWLFFRGRFADNEKYIFAVAFHHIFLAAKPF